MRKDLKHLVEGNFQKTRVPKDSKILELSTNDLRLFPDDFIQIEQNSNLNSRPTNLIFLSVPNNLRLDSNPKNK